MGAKSSASASITASRGSSCYRPQSDRPAADHGDRRRQQFADLSAVESGLYVSRYEERESCALVMIFMLDAG